MNILLFLIATVFPIHSVVTSDTLFVFDDTPNVSSDLIKQEASYTLSTIIDTLYKGDSIDVLVVRHGIKNDDWAWIEYKEPAIDSISPELNGIKRAYIATKNGWALIKWGDDTFIKYISNEGSKFDFGMGVLLFGQSAKIFGNIESGGVSYRIYGIIALALMVAFFVLIFWRKSAKAFSLDHATVGMKFKIWIVFVVVTLMVICGLKLQDLKILFTGKV